MVGPSREVITVSLYLKRLVNLVNECKESTHPPDQLQIIDLMRRNARAAKSAQIRINLLIGFGARGAAAASGSTEVSFSGGDEGPNTYYICSH
jgi:hypothetical protein